MTETLSESRLRDQWILDRLEAGELKMDFSITPEDEFSSFFVLAPEYAK